MADATQSQDDRRQAERQKPERPQAVRRPLRPLPIFAACISALVLLPVLSIVWLAFSGGTADLVHLAQTILPQAWLRTLLLLGFTGLFTALIGISTAWLTVMAEFPLRRLLTPALVLPLAIPGYLAAYAFGEFFDFTGPVQSILRLLLGVTSRRDYWFFELRSLPGAVFVLSSVLYPYVYLSCRTMFLMQGRQAADVARTLGASPLRVFLNVQLPMARPAIIVGLTLVMMEALNDIGAVEYLGVNTLTFAIYSTWLNRGSLAGAAQIACLLMGFVAILIMVERMARARQRFSERRTTALAHSPIRLPLSPIRALAATFLCLLPVLAGFVIPLVVLATYASHRLGHFFDARLTKALTTSLGLAGGTAVATVLLGFVLAYANRGQSARLMRIPARLASLGYGLPGTVLAIGVLLPLAGLDNLVASLMKSSLGISPGLILTGSGFAIVFACTVRFLTMAEGSIASGFEKLSPHLDMASRTLGRTPLQTLTGVLVPNLKPAVLTAALLVFIETLKELSATILLRPFGFSTLATLVYEDASRSKVADASVAAMIIILAGIVPVLIVSRSLHRNAAERR